MTKKLLPTIIIAGLMVAARATSIAQATTLDTSAAQHAPSVSVYRASNRSSNIAFSKLPETTDALVPPQTLSFRYTYTNANPKGSYRFERTFYSPLGVVISRSTVTKTLRFNETYEANVKQFLSPALLSGLFSIEVKITSANGKKTYDHNSFDLLIQRKK